MDDSIHCVKNSIVATTAASQTGLLQTMPDKQCHIAMRASLTTQHIICNKKYEEICEMAQVLRNLACAMPNQSNA